VLTWNVASVCMVADAQENRKPNKLKSTGRIDGALALIMGVGTMLRGASAERSPEYQLLFV
jgi:phage terminase large subunit-like protein